MNAINPVTPDSYLQGIRYVADLGTITETQAWLRNEIFESFHALSGGWDDYPVQAIVNHYRYFPEDVKVFVNAAFLNLLVEWQVRPEDWPEDMTRSLLSLVSELHIPQAKENLVRFVGTMRIMDLAVKLHLAVFRAISTLSTKEDIRFWQMVIEEVKRGTWPGLDRMAFQTLDRINQLP